MKPQAESGTVAPVPGKDAKEQSESLDPYGDLVPFADPSWYQSVSRRSGSKAPMYLLVAGTDLVYSITRRTSMNHTLLSVPKFVNGWSLRLNLMSRSGMRARISQIASTSKWAKEVILQV